MERQHSAARFARLSANSASAISQLTCGNRLLNRLSEKEAARVIPLFERVALHPRQVLHHWDIPIEHVYFIESGLVSIMAKIGGDRAVVVWLVGSDGMVGAPIILGDSCPPHRRVVLIGGTALRMRVPAFRRLIETSPPLRALVNRYLQLVLMRTSQSGACNARHSVRQRLARWLLLARDALGQDAVTVPHEVLARLIGVRRATISKSLQEIEERSAIRTGRRLIQITDNRILQTLSCDCYSFIAHERRRLLGMIPAAVETPHASPISHR
jgi:CRP-like cAMP-binding protein